MSYVDLHLHLLPRVDDGARDLPEARRHARRLERDGVHEAVLTPHIGHPQFDVEVRLLRERVAAFQREINAAGIRLQVRCGGELHPLAAAELSDGELDVLAQGPLDSRWLLLEAPFAGIDESFLLTASALQRRGYGLVIAHPERAIGGRRAAESRGRKETSTSVGPGQARPCWSGRSAQRGSGFRPALIGLSVFCKCR